jgi:hypothetical protein
LDIIATTSPFFTLSEVEQHIKDASLKSKDKETLEKVTRDFNTKLDAPGTVDDAFWTASLLQDVDDVAAKCFSGVMAEIGMNDDRYLTALSSYTRHVQDLMQRHHPRRQGLDVIVARFKWMMAPKENIRTPMPLATEFVFESIVHSLSMVSLAIDEVS